VFLARVGQGLTHAQVLQALLQRGHTPDRVTLYRLLERLAACGVLARHSDERRTWRFTLVGAEARARAQGPAPRFECRHCGQARVLTDWPPAVQRAWRELMGTLTAQGEQVERIDIAVHGVCARCAAMAGDT
jgi:Fur family ferric uptake transcriptional regulator